MSNEHEDATTPNNNPSPEVAALNALATRLIDDTGIDQLRLLMGSVSAQLSLEVPVPEGSTIFGSLERENGDVTVVAEAAAQAPLALSAGQYRQRPGAAQDSKTAQQRAFGFGEKAITPFDGGAQRLVAG